MNRITAVIKDGKFFYFPKYERKDRVFYILIFLAFIRPIGFVFQSPAMDGIGAATCISPLPTVFSKPGGIEAFTSRFLIVYSASSTKTDTVAITSAMFSKIEGPHPFRNAVSLLFGYFALIPGSTARSTLHYLFYEKKILQSMGIPLSDHYTLINRNGAGIHQQEWCIQINAHEK